MNTKLILPVILGIFLLTFICATPLQDLFSEEATGITITLRPDETSINFYVDTSGYDWDIHHIEFEIMEDSITEMVMSVSDFLDEINLREDFNDGEDYPEFIDFNLNGLCDIKFDIEGIDIGFGEISIEGATINMLMPFIKSMPEYEDVPLCNEIDLDFINSSVQENLPQLEIIGNSYFLKYGIDYDSWKDSGWDDVPSDSELNIYLLNIEKAITEGVSNLNPRSLISDYILPYVDYNFEDFFSEIDYTVVGIDWKDLEINDGEYSITVTVRNNLNLNELVTKDITVIVEGFPIECTPDRIYTEWSSWSDTEVCQGNDFLTQERSRIKYDSDNCQIEISEDIGINFYDESGNEVSVPNWLYAINEVVNETEYDYQEVSCDYCIPSPIYTIWSEWEDEGTCSIDDLQTQIRTRTFYDDNSCGEIEDVIEDESREISCDYCTPDLVYTSWSEWSDTEDCQDNDFLTQMKERILYDENSCGEVESTTEYEYQESFCDYCTPSWELDDAWSTCDITDNQYKDYYDINECNELETKPESISQTCDYCTPDMVYTEWTEWLDTETCQSNDFLTQEKKRTIYDINDCGEMENLTLSEFQEVSCDFCNSDLIYTDWSDWENEGNCQITNLQIQVRSRIKYNLCGEDEILYEYQEIPCDYCTPSLVYTEWVGWFDTETCQSNNFLTQVKERTLYDENYCGEIEDETEYDYKEVSCDYCTPNLVYTGWTDWSNTEDCQDNDFLTQTRVRTLYDENYCGEIDEEFFREYQEVSCDSCIPDLDYTSWSDWEDEGTCSIDDLQTQIRERTLYDDNFCGEIEDVIEDESREIDCDYCTPDMVYTEWTSWEDEGVCLINNLRTQIRTRAFYDDNSCGEIEDEIEYESRESECDYCASSWLWYWDDLKDLVIPMLDLNSDNISDIVITLKPNETLIEFELEVEDLEQVVDFRIDFKDGELYPEVTNLKIDLREADLLLLNELIKQNIPPNLEQIVGDAYFEKDGVNYEIWYDDGFGSISDEYLVRVEEIILQNIYIFDLQQLLDSTNEFDVCTDLLSQLEYEATINFNDLVAENGKYEVLVEFSNGGKTYSESIEVVINGIETEYDYIPHQETIRNRIRAIKGLELGNNVRVSFLDLSETIIPGHLNGLQLMNITLDYSQQAEIHFAVGVNEVENKNNVFLYIYEGNSWDKLVINYLREENEYYEYSATAPHFSLFLVAERVLDDDDDDDSGGSSRHRDNEPEPIEKLDDVIVADDDEDEEVIILTPPEKEKVDLRILIVGLILGIILLIAFISYIIVRRNRGQTNMEVNSNDQA